MADTRAAAILAAIRERWSKVAYVGLKPEVVPEPGHQPEWLPDVPRLVAAVEAGMGTAARWAAEAARARALAEASIDLGQPVSSAAMSYRAQALTNCARELRAAVSAALAGEDGDGD